MKLKAQTEILEDKSSHYKTKYQEIDQELITEIREHCPIETQLFLKELKITAKRRKKNPEQKTTGPKILLQKEEKEKKKQKNPLTKGK